MITLAKLLEQQLKSAPFLEDLINQKLINLSELARQLQPKIEKELIKPISSSSIMMALTRLAKKNPLKDTDKISSSMVRNIMLRSGLVELTYKNSNKLIENLKKILEKIEEKDFFTWTKGIYETTIIVSKEKEMLIKEFMKNQTQKFHIKDLSAVTVELKEGNIEGVGVYYSLLKRLAWEGVAIQEIVSTATELTLILKNDDVGRVIEELNFSN